MKVKLLALVVAVMTAMLGLCACSCQQTSSTGESASSSSATIEPISPGDVTAFTGTTDDGKYNVQFVGQTNPEAKDSQATLVLEEVETGKVTKYSGEITLENVTTYVLTDAENGTVEFLMGNVLKNGKLEVGINLYGFAIVTPGDPETVKESIETTLAEAESK